MPDPFDTAGMRRRVLHAWAASPARFREDANAEEDLALGGYRDRLLVELAQNAADAAAAAGEPGTLRLRLAGGVLRAANTGAPLDAAGVAALASLRASAKRDGDSVGRYGVGFAAVLAVTDEPEVASHGGGVRFSAAQTRRAVAQIPSLAAEVRRRGGAVPVLRLPWPAADPPPDGFVTEVRLPLHPAAVPVVRAALGDLDSSILLSLPALSTLDVDGRRLARDGDGPDVVISDAGVPRRWRVVRAGGHLPPELMAGRPTEERHRPWWSVLWAVPDGGLTGRQVVYAPTPSDEPLSVPARLVASFPLGPDRRHVAPGPLTDWLVGRCAESFCELVTTLAPGPELLALVPAPGIAGGELDAALCSAILAGLRSARWLPGRSAPTTARVLELGLEQAVPLLLDVIPGLLPAPWSGRAAQRPLQALGVRRLRLAEVVDAVAGLDRPPGWWHALYYALADLPDRDALAALPVPLADGSTVTGARGVLLPEPGLPVPDLAALDVRLAHPDAMHPLLERLGGMPASPSSVLSDPRVRAQVAAAYDDEDPAPLAEAVLSLVAADGPAPGSLPWLADLPLPAEDGELYPAGELLLPGSPLAAVMAPDAPFGIAGADLVQRWGAGVLSAVGVLSTFAVVRAEHVDSAELDLDDEQRYLDEAIDGDLAVLTELVAVRDLELVDPQCWPAALELLGSEPLRRLVLADAELTPGGRRVPSYTRWWLGRHRVLGGQRPRDLRLPDADDLAGLYDAATGDEPLLRLLGCRAGLDDVLADVDGARSLLWRLGDPRLSCTWPTLRQAYRRIAGLLGDEDPPALVRVAPDRVVAAEEAVVLDLPCAVGLLGDRHAVAGGEPVAHLLDLPLASELVTGVVTGPVVGRPAWHDVPGARLAADRLGAPLPAGPVTVRSGLGVDGTPVDWWADRDGDHVDAAAAPATWGRMLAWRLGRWASRGAAIEAFERPADEALLRAEDLCS